MVKYMFEMYSTEADFEMLYGNLKAQEQYHSGLHHSFVEQHLIKQLL